MHDLPLKVQQVMAYMTEKGIDSQLHLSTTANYISVQQPQKQHF